MYLEGTGAVDHLTACTLEPLGPADVVFLVEPGTELHQHQHPDAVFRRPAQGVNHLAVPGNPVQGDLDGQHGFILRSLLEQPQKGADGIIGVVEENVLLFDLGKHGAGFGHLGGFLGHPLGIKQGILLQHVLEAVHKGQIQGRLCREDLAVLDAQLLPEKVRCRLAEAVGKLDPHGHQLAALLDELLHNLAEVVGIVVKGVGNGNVRTAGNPQQGPVDDLVIFEDGRGKA